MVIGLTALLLVALVWRGAGAIQDSFARRSAEPAQPLFQFVAATRSPDDLYLVPPSMAEFRLETGAPVFVTYKSHPYKDVEIIEWYDRLETADDFYADVDCDRLGELSAERMLSHVVFIAGQEVQACTGTTEIYRDDSYVLLQVDNRG